MEQEIMYDLDAWGLWMVPILMSIKFNPANHPGVYVTAQDVRDFIEDYCIYPKKWNLDKVVRGRGRMAI